MKNLTWPNILFALALLAGVALLIVGVTVSGAESLEKYGEWLLVFAFGQTLPQPKKPGARPPASSNLIVLLAALAVFLAIPGCGAAQRADASRALDESLNTITDVVDPAYALLVQTCEARGQAIVDRQGTSYEQDVAAHNLLRRRCTLADDHMQAVRKAQAAARDAAAAFRSGDVDYSAAIEALADLRATWDQVRHIIDELTGDEPATSGGES